MGFVHCVIYKGSRNSPAIAEICICHVVGFVLLDPPPPATRISVLHNEAKALWQIKHPSPNR